MTKEALKQFLLQALANNTLLTDKHDPNKLDIVWPKNRTVISHQVARDLFHFITNGIARIFEYENHEGKYYEIVPQHFYEFASSGVSAYSQLPYQGFNRVIAVEGGNQGWHLYGEDSTTIASKLSKGQLRNKVELL